MLQPTSAGPIQKTPPPPAISVPVYSLSTPIPSHYSVNNGDNNGAAVVIKGDDDAEHDTQETSMNIITFTSPVSVAAPKLWMVSLYKGTLTKISFLGNDDENNEGNGTKIGVLQLLRPHQAGLVPALGKRSGMENVSQVKNDNRTDKEELIIYNKKTVCKELGFEWSKNTCNFFSSQEDADKAASSAKKTDFYLLPECAVYIYLRVLNTMDAGDHDMALCEVLGT